MKKVALWSGVAILGVIGIALVAAFQFGEPSPVIASGTVFLSPGLTADAKGIRTVYITVFDAKSPTPMPYGAMQEKLDGDAKGKVLDFVLTKERLRVMNPDAPYPQLIRIKARLDKDGMGGPDQPGDLTGEVVDIVAGTQDITIKIETKVQ